MLNFLSSSYLKPLSLALGILSIMLIAGYNLSIKPAQQRIIKLKKTNLLLAHHLQTAKQSLQQKASLINNQRMLRKQIKYQSLFNQQILLVDLTHAANLAKISITAIPQNKNSINLTAVGNYQQLVQLMHLVTQIPYPLAFSQLTLTPKATKLLLHASYTVYLTPFPTLTPVPTMFTLENSALHDPFALNKNQLPLSVWPSNALRFIGTLQQNQKIWAIISDPNGVIHHVTLGAAIGIDQSPITKITAEEIITKNPNDDLYRDQENTFYN